VAAAGRHNADELLVLALARGLTVEQAAAEAGVSPRTAHRRLADPAFRPRIAAAQGKAVAQAIGLLADGTIEAARVLRELLGQEQPAVRLNAARTLLQLYPRSTERRGLTGCWNEESGAR